MFTNQKETKRAIQAAVDQANKVKTLIASFVAVHQNRMNGQFSEKTVVLIVHENLNDSRNRSNPFLRFQAWTKELYPTVLVTRLSILQNI